MKSVSALNFQIKDLDEGKLNQTIHVYLLSKQNSGGLLCRIKKRCCCSAILSSSVCLLWFNTMLGIMLSSSIYASFHKEIELHFALIAPCNFTKRIVLSPTPSEHSPTSCICAINVHVEMLTLLPGESWLTIHHHVQGEWVTLLAVSLHEVRGTCALSLWYSLSTEEYHSLFSGIYAPLSCWICCSLPARELRSPSTESGPDSEVLCSPSLCQDVLLNACCTLSCALQPIVTSGVSAEQLSWACRALCS